MKIEVLTREPISLTEAAACAYLLAPLFLFFLFYINVAIAVPACVLITWCVWELCHSATRPRIDAISWSTLALFIFAAIWVFLGGSFGIVGLNSDWPKHFAVFNFLSQSKDGLYAGPKEVMRYSIGWYLVPSSIAKATATGAYWNAALLGVWSILGVWIFFRLLVDLVGGGRRSFCAPLVFILFSGADIVGTAITGFHLGPRYHLEWWIGWVSYDSNTTSLFWVPQHAIAAWLMIGLLLRQIKRPTLLPYVALLFAATQLWSPLVTLGLMPFGGYLLLRPGGNAMLRDWRTWASIIFAGLPTALYLTSSAQSLPIHLQWNRPCPTVFPCFTWPAFPLFLAVEVLAFLLVLVVWKPARTGALAVAAISLTLIPLLSIGWANDFGMRVSLPALAVVAIGTAELVIRAQVKISVPMLIVIALGAATPMSEVARGLIDHPTIDPAGGFEEIGNQEVSLMSQYFAPPRTWLMRK